MRQSSVTLVLLMNAEFLTTVYMSGILKDNIKLAN